MGTSRKAFVGRLLRRSPNDPASAPAPRDRVHGSCAAAVISAQGGASVVRVHDVAETVDALRVADAVYRSL
jgi:dihydropteroate synthase